MAIRGNHIGSVYIKVRPDAKDFRRETERDLGKELDRKPLEIPVDVDLDVKDVERQIDKVEKKLQKMATIHFDADYDGINRAIKQVERKLKDLRMQEIEFTPDVEGLEKALSELEAEQRDSRFVVNFAPDEKGYNDVLKKIEAIRRDKITKEVSFNTDEGSMGRLESDMREKLNELKLAAPVTIDITEDEAGYTALLKRIEQLRAERRSVTVDLKVNDAELSALEYRTRELLAKTREVKFKFTEDLEGSRKFLERIQQFRRERYEVEVNLNVDDDELKRMERKALDRVLRLRPVVDPLSAGFAEGSLAALSRDRYVDIKARVNKRSLALVEGMFQSLAGLNTVGDMVRKIENVAMSFDEVMMSVGFATGAIGSLVSVGTVGLGALMSVAKDTAQAFQLIAMAPAALLSMSAGLQTWKAIWSDFGAALMGIPGVLESLPPQAQRGVKAIQALNKAVNQTVQDNFWGQMNDEIYRFIRDIGPTVTRVMGTVAQEMGRAVSEMLTHTDKLVKSGQLEEFARNNARLYHNLADAAIPFFEGFMTMGIQGSRYLPQFGRWMEDLAFQFRAFADEAARTGKFDMWIRQGINSVQSLGKTAAATTKIMGNLTRVFERAGVGGLHEMARGLERIEAFTATSNFQGKLEGIFRAAMDGSREVGKGFADLARALWDADDVVNEVLRKSGRLAGVFMSAIADAGSEPILHKGLLDALDGLTTFVERAQPAYDAIARIMGRLGSIGAEVAAQIAPGLNLTMNLIDNFLARIGSSLAGAVHPLTMFLEHLTALASGPVMAAANALKVLLDAFNSLPGPIQNVITLLLVMNRLGLGTAIAGMATAIQGSMARTNEIARRGSVAFAGHMTAMQVAAHNAGRGIRAGLSGLSAAFGGPWGLAIGGAIALMASFAGANAEAEARVDALTRAMLDQDKSALRRGIYEDMKSELEGFAQAGGDVAKVMDELQSGNYAQVAADLDLAYKSMGAWQSGLTSDDALFALGLQREEFEKGMDAARRYGISNEEAGSAARGLSSKVTSSIGVFEAAAAAADSEAAALGGVSDGMVDVATRSEAAAIRSQLFNEALDRMIDKTASAEERARGLSDMLDLLGNRGKEQSARDMEKGATNAIAQAVAEAERIAKDNQFDWSNIFKDGQFNVDDVFGAQLDDMAIEVTSAFEARFSAIRDKLDQGLITPEKAAAEFDRVMRDMGASAEQFADKLGRTGEERDQLIAVWESYTPSRTELEIVLDAAQAKAQMESDIAYLKSLGEDFNDERWEAEFDANNDGFVSGQERALSLGQYFHGQVFSAFLEGNESDVRAAYENALSMGVVWDGSEWISTLDANGQPTKNAMAAAKRLGFEWDGSKWVATVDADEKSAKSAVAAAERAGKGYDGNIYQAYVKALDNASGVIDAVARKMAALKSRTLYINTHLSTTTGPAAGRRTMQANGSLTDSPFKPQQVKRFASGGFENHTAQIASPSNGTVRIWAEPETGGEAYIPMSVSKRARSLAIWQEVGKRFGVYANGGMNGGGEAAGVVNNITVTKSEASGDDVAQSFNYHMLKARR